MTTTALCEPRVRPLRDWEIEEARKVFGNRLDYAPIRIHECARPANLLDDLGRRLKRMPAREGNVNNALTLGNNPYYSVQLPTKLIGPDQKGSYFMPWLMHELTHCYQFQRLGWRYLLMALGAQFRHGAHAYDYGGWHNLMLRRQQGWKFHHFNLEQQGDITRDYYRRLRKGKPVNAWQSYIDDIQTIY